MTERVVRKTQFFRNNQIYYKFIIDLSLCKARVSCSKFLGARTQTLPALRHGAPSTMSARVRAPSTGIGLSRTVSYVFCVDIETARLGIFVFLWYVCSIFQSIWSKSVLKQFPHPMTLTMGQYYTLAVVMPLVMHFTGKETVRARARSHRPMCTAYTLDSIPHPAHIRTCHVMSACAQTDAVRIGRPCSAVHCCPRACTCVCLMRAPVRLFVCACANSRILWPTARLAATRRHTAMCACVCVSNYSYAMRMCDCLWRVFSQQSVAMVAMVPFDARPRTCTMCPADEVHAKDVCLRSDSTVLHQAVRLSFGKPMAPHSMHVPCTMPCGTELPTQEHMRPRARV